MADNWAANPAISPKATRSQGQTQCEEDNSLEEAFCRNRENNAKRNDLHEKEYNHENGMNTTKDLNRAEMELILEDRIIPEKERSKRNVGNLWLENK